MGEPLKDKRRVQKLCYTENALNCYKGRCGDCRSKDFVYNYEDKDIKSAVEWLKEYIRNSKTIGDGGMLNADYVLERIDEAFPDLIKEE